MNRTPVTSPRPGRSRRGASPSLIVGVVALAVAAGAGVLSFEYGPWPARGGARAASLTGGELAAALARAGLDAPALAASGASAAQATALVGAARAHLTLHVQALRAADNAAGTARRALDLEARRVRSGQAGGRGDLVACRAALAEAEAGVRAALDALFAAAVDGLDGAVVDRLRQIHGGRWWDLPTPYLAAARSEADWVGLRDALAQVRIAARRGEGVDQSVTQFIQSQDADENVAAARQRLDSAGASVGAAWDAAVSG